MDITEKQRREIMKQGVQYARNHLISAYLCNFINCDEKTSANIMALLSHVSSELIDIELMMDDMLSCNQQAEDWIKSIQS
ncbi:hypothetical protein [Morganella psychrotolerans]|uniref:Uncharacterized protein n=1 Tax=Morganella psychrotolerans TaxID=368603 RepID=A0A1B8HNV1_9GAMM|nr:hypothetical protein [Morganella psychrotolerans]OBU11149.1 hypothetical protein AYY18_04270 [Morganella psychrotolerans]